MVKQPAARLYEIVGTNRKGAPARLLLWGDSVDAVRTKAHFRGVAAKHVKPCKIPVRDLGE